MKCSACGNALASDAHFCPRCGAAQAPQPFASAAYGLGYRPYNRVAHHLQGLSILWMVYAAYRALTGLLGLVFLHGFFNNHFGHDWNMGWNPFNHIGAAVWLPLAFLSLTISVVCCALTGFALSTRQSWGRVVAIIFSILALFHPFLGTALGIYTLWVLAPSLSGTEYDALTARRTA